MYRRGADFVGILSPPPFQNPGYAPGVCLYLIIYIDKLKSANNYSSWKRTNRQTNKQNRTYVSFFFFFLYLDLFPDFKQYSICVYRFILLFL